MVAQNQVRKYEVNQEFRFVKGIWLHRKSQIRNFLSDKTFLLYMSTTWSKLPSYISAMPSPSLSFFLSRSPSLPIFFFLSLYLTLVDYACSLSFFSLSLVSSTTSLLWNVYLVFMIFFMFSMARFISENANDYVIINLKSGMIL